MKKNHVVIIGGGISGLSAAYFLSRRSSAENVPLKITVLEAADRFGGVLRTLRRQEFSIEAAADTFDGSRPDALDLCAGLGLTAKLTGSESFLENLSIRRGRKTFPVPFSARVLASGALDFGAKVRMIPGLWISGKINEADESIGDFIRRRFGPRFLEQAAAPLIRGVMMAEPGDLSARTYFPARKDRNKTAGKAWTLQGGMDRLVTALAECLQKHVALRLHAAVRAVSRAGLWKVTLETRETLDADVVCLAMPACRSAVLLRDAAPELSAALSGIRYDPVAVVNLIFRPGDVPSEGRRPGFIVPGPEERWPFSSLKWVGVDGAGSWVRAKVFLSGALHKNIYGLPDATITEKISAVLKEEWNIPEPVWAGVERYPGALAQYETGHAARVVGIEKLLENNPGLFLTGNGYHGFGITDCVRRARIAAAQVFRALL